LAGARADPGSFSKVRHNHEIAQIASLYEAVPPKLYGGTERIVAHLADVFVELGNDVILFSSADARPKWAVKVQRLLAQCEHLPRALHLAKWAAYAYAAQAAAGVAIGLALPWVRL
jgi:hypothetical protein